MSAVEAAIDLDSSDYRYWGNVGIYYRWTPGNEAKSEPALRKAIELAAIFAETNKSDYTPHANLAEYKARLGDAKGALAEIERIPAAARAPFTTRLAIVYELTGHRDKAIAVIRANVKSPASLNQIKDDPDLAALWREGQAPVVPRSSFSKYRYIYLDLCFNGSCPSRGSAVPSSSASRRCSSWSPSASLEPRRNGAPFGQRFFWIRCLARVMKPLRSTTTSAAAAWCCAFRSFFNSVWTQHWENCPGAASREKQLPDDAIAWVTNTVLARSRRNWDIPTSCGPTSCWSLTLRMQHCAAAGHPAAAQTEPLQTPQDPAAGRTATAQDSILRGEKGPGLRNQNGERAARLQGGRDRQ